jgi:hypothetical protein
MNGNKMTTNPAMSKSAPVIRDTKFSLPLRPFHNNKFTKKSAFFFHTIKPINIIKNPIETGNITPIISNTPIKSIIFTNIT